jgi:DNA-directed RNA polymerase specialized sigma24 family protein
MPSGGDLPDDLPDRAPGVSSDGQPGVNDAGGTAEALALGDEHGRTDQSFEDIVRTAGAELLDSARSYARRLVGANDADDALNTVWEKIWTRFDPARGEFKAFFFTALHHECLDILRHRRVTPQPWADLPADWEPGYGTHFPDPADEVIARIDDLQDRIAAAIEVLDLPAGHRGMLRMMLDTQDASPPAAGKAADAIRQQRKRLRRVLDERAGLTPGELEAASLVRRHHTVAAAAAAAPGSDVPGLYASAKRKVLALFPIETEDDLT